MFLDTLDFLFFLLLEAIVIFAGGDGREREGEARAGQDSSTQELIAPHLTIRGSGSIRPLCQQARTSSIFTEEKKTDAVKGSNRRPGHFRAAACFSFSMPKQRGELGDTNETCSVVSRTCCSRTYVCTRVC
jgi:hypothetical protein